MNGNDAISLCLECGLCCNGAIFADVELQPTEIQIIKSKFEHLKPDGKNGRRDSAKLPQPCPAFDGCRCRIYSDRPRHCRQFECQLLKNVRSGKITRLAASQIVRTAKNRAEKVRALLRELGDTEEQIPLRLRFQRAAKRYEKARLHRDKVEIYSGLTLAMHELNLLLRDAFYPG